MYSFDWLYGFVCSIVIYTVLHKIFPAKESLMLETIDGVEVMAERKSAAEYNPDTGSGDDEKGFERKRVAEI
jgi:NCS1 family nucleobase:cation symporter-1